MAATKSDAGEIQVKTDATKENEKQLKKDKEKQTSDADKKEERAYSMRPTFGEGEMFPLPTIKNIMSTVMSQKLKDKTYDKVLATTWTHEIADEVNQKIAGNPKVKRYKHVVQVMLGQELGAGATYNSRCCWDCDCDTSVSEVFSNTSLFCVCTVFGTYQY